MLVTAGRVTSVGVTFKTRSEKFKLIIWCFSKTQHAQHRCIQQPREKIFSAFDSWLVAAAVNGDRQGVVGNHCLCCLCPSPYLESYGDDGTADLFSHHELLSQHGQDDVLPESTGQTFTQADDPLAAAAVGLILTGRQEEPGCDRQVRGGTGVRRTAVERRRFAFLPPTWVWSPPWTGGSHCVRSGHLDAPDDCRTSRTAPPDTQHMMGNISGWKHQRLSLRGSLFL